MLNVKLKHRKVKSLLTVLNLEDLVTLMEEQEISAVFWRVGIIICNPELSLWLLCHQGCALKKRGFMK